MNKKPTRRETSYRSWIDEHYPDAVLCRNKCMEAVERMQAEFPELKRQSGYVGSIEHNWLVAPNGEIVDPTARQFGVDRIPKSDYEIYADESDVVGKCVDCGEYWKNSPNSPFCSRRCEESYRKYLMDGRL